MINSDQLIDRARLLMEQQRYDQAEDLLRQALVQDPDSGLVHSLLACSLKRDRDQLSAALLAAQRGVHLAPDDAFSYYALAAVQESQNQIKQAVESIEQAISLAPLDGQLHGFHAHLLIRLQRWQAALQAAEAGLNLDPEDPACASARTFALERLGRVSDAVGEAQRAVRNDPDSSDAHAGLGWAMLRSGKYREAQISFREALRLDPSSEFARQGMISALNSSNIVFRVFDSLMMRISRMSGGMQWALILGLFFGTRMLNSAADTHVWLRPYVIPITLAYLLFVMMSWIMHPLFNTLLRFHPFGRYLLSRKEVWASQLIAGAIFSGSLVGLALMAMHGMHLFLGALPFLFGVFLTIPISIAFRTTVPWATLTASVIAVLFTLLFVAISISLLMDQLPQSLISVYQLGILLYCFAGQALIAQQPRY
jgi:tetratricopeptide (TPR) repeat protein